MTRDIDTRGKKDSDSQGSVPPDTQPVRARGSRWRLPIAGGIVLVIVAVVFAFLLHVVPGKSTPPRQAASTATPSPKILYTADWSHGIGGWTLPPHWSLVNGSIENDGLGTAPLLIPYQVTVPDYSIAVDFTVEKIPDVTACHSYGIEGFSTGSTLQFLASISCIRKLTVAYHGFSQNYVAHADSVGDQMSTNDYTVLFVNQTFSVQVLGKSVDFCPGISCLSNVNSTTPLSPLQIAIYDINVQLSISRIVITSP